MYTILDALTRLVAPILSFTADEIWQSMPHAEGVDTRSVLLNDMPESGKYAFGDIEAHWNALFDLRDEVLKALEDARAAKLIGKSLEAKVIISANDEKYALLDSFKSELETVFIVSQVELKHGEGEALGVEVVHADGEKCDRCWMYSTETVADGDGHLCKRCAAILA
jgi:isoleucyl-tRNA synthetase